VINLWDKYKDIVTPIDPTINKRKTRFIVTCLTCSNKREISYAQAWNIIKDNNSGNCQSCAEKNKPPRPKKEKIKKRKLSDCLKYRNMFENPAKDPVVREKMRLAKLGKTKEQANNWQGGDTEEKLIKRREKKKQYIKKRLKEDPCARAIKYARTRVAHMIRKNNLKSKSKKLGCDFKTFKAHIENKFYPGMSWENYGEWHIDHIFPLSVAIKISEEKFFECCHYTNLQPLWAVDNIKKNNKIPKELL